MRRRDFFKGLFGTVLALAAKPFMGLMPKTKRSYPGRLCSPFPRRLHGRLEGWEVEDESGLLSRYGQTLFATYDNSGNLKHGYISYRLVNEERGEIQATTEPSVPFALGDEIRMNSTTGVYKGLARAHAPAVLITQMNQDMKDAWDNVGVTLPASRIYKL